MEIFNESVIQKEKFKLAANKLLNKCFIIKKKEDTRNEYIFILQHKDLFNEYFDLLGYKIEINETHGVVALTNTEGRGRHQFKKIESIILLIIRLIYIEKRKELSLNEQIIILSEEIHEKYRMLKIDKKASIDKTAFKGTISLLKRYNILSNIDTDIMRSDARIIIYPSILFAVPNDNLTQLSEAVSERLDNYFQGGEPIGEDEETDQD